MGPRTWRPYGRPVFHFGLIFLALGLISSTLLPLAQAPEVLAWRDTLSTPVRALIFGTVLTMLVQSSAVVVGLTVLSVAGGLLEPTLSIWVVVGANLGTGWVAFINASALGPFARRLASFNCCLDLAGLALFVTVLQFAIRPLLAMIDDPGLQVAFVHSAFNLSAATLALILLPWLWRYLEKYVPKSEVGVSG
jgi:phosphate:Na+ symporter